jgi:hypothetical protein
VVPGRVIIVVERIDELSIRKQFKMDQLDESMNHCRGRTEPQKRRHANRKRFSRLFRTIRSTSSNSRSLNAALKRYSTSGSFFFVRRARRHLPQRRTAA